MGSAERVLRRIEGSDRWRYLPIVGRDRGRVLVELVRRHRPRRILEVGTFVGYSAILMGRELGRDSEIVTIEMDREAAELARRNIQEAGIEPRVEVLVGDALEIIPEVEGEFDMVFLDADKGEYFEYLRLVEGKLRKGSVVVADNVRSSSYSMRDYLDHVRNSGLYESRFIRAGWDGMEVSVRL
jgi:predicted O-methyltransferase YrrM